MLLGTILILLWYRRQTRNIDRQQSVVPHEKYLHGFSSLDKSSVSCIITGVGVAAFCVTPGMVNLMSIEPHVHGACCGVFANSKLFGGYPWSCEMT
uniref:Putative metalloprotease n=1 Tax=Ixodes ricinus TaxID=34613 RepID=A0A0K8R604_IXORI